MPTESDATKESSDPRAGDGHKASAAMKVRGGKSTAPDGSGTTGGNGSKNPSSMPVRGGGKKKA